MKTLKLVDPSKAVQTVALTVHWNREITTCHTSNCNHFSHDPWYRSFKADFPDELTLRYRPGTPSTHAWTKLESELAPDDLSENGGNWWPVTADIYPDKP